MTNDKVRQDFETKRGLTESCRMGDSYRIPMHRTAWLAHQEGYQAGRAAERAEIVAKLESEVVAEALYNEKHDYLVSRGDVKTYEPFKKLAADDCAKIFFICQAKAAITKILEVI